jgi:hypothetical protein
MQHRGTPLNARFAIPMAESDEQGRFRAPSPLAAATEQQHRTWLLHGSQLQHRRLPDSHGCVVPLHL